MADRVLTWSTDENLMITDLITHGLHGVVGEKLVVKKICGVEEYKIVWQLVSVIEGILPWTIHSPGAGWGLGCDLLGDRLPWGEPLSLSSSTVY